jgi:hypothetical protein
MLRSRTLSLSDFVDSDYIIDAMTQISPQEVQVWSWNITSCPVNSLQTSRIQLLLRTSCSISRSARMWSFMHVDAFSVCLLLAVTDSLIVTCSCKEDERWTHEGRIDSKYYFFYTRIFIIMKLRRITYKLLLMSSRCPSVHYNRKLSTKP